MSFLEEIALGSNVFQIIGFRLRTSTGNPIFGVNAAKVREIISSRLAPEGEAGGPPSLLGAFEYRGERLPLIDLAGAAGLAAPVEAHDPEADRVIITTEFSGRLAGFLVREVVKLYSLPASRLEAAPLKNGWMNFVVYFARLEGGEILSMLDFERIASDLGLSPPDLAAEGPAPARAGAPKTVLLAEDSAFIRKRLVNFLQDSAGHRVIACADGQEAWERLEEIHHRAQAEDKKVDDYVQLISSDVEMPRMDGMSLLVRAKADPRFRHLPFVIVSTLSTAEQIRKCMEGGASGYLVKLDAGQLLDVVAKNAL